MAIKIQVRRGTLAQVQATVFDVGEPWYAADAKTFGFGDGATPGGSPALPRKTATVNLPAACGTLAVDISALGLAIPPFLVIPVVFKADGTKAGIQAEPRLDGLTAINVNIDLTGDTPDATYVLRLLVIP